MAAALRIFQVLVEQKRRDLDTMLRLQRSLGLYPSNLKCFEAIKEELRSLSTEEAPFEETPQGRDTQQKVSFYPERSQRQSCLIPALHLKDLDTQTNRLLSGKEIQPQPLKSFSIHGLLCILTKSLAMLCIFLLVLCVLFSLHQEGKLDPFKGHPNIYVGFVITIMFTFASAASFWLIRDTPELSALHRCYFLLTMLFLASALSILAYALCLEAFRFSTPVVKLSLDEGGLMSHLHQH